MAYKFNYFKTQADITVILTTAQDMYEFEQLIYAHDEYDTPFENYMRYHKFLGNIQFRCNPSPTVKGTMIYTLTITGTDWKRFQEIQTLLEKWLKDSDTQHEIVRDLQEKEYQAYRVQQEAKQL